MIKNIAAGAAKESPALVFGPALWLRDWPGGEWLHDATTPSEWFDFLKDVPGMDSSLIVSETPDDFFWWWPQHTESKEAYIARIRLIQENESVHLRTEHHMAPWPKVSFPTNSKLSRDSATAVNRRDFHPLKAETPMAAAGSSTPPRATPVVPTTPVTAGQKRYRSGSPVPLFIPLSESPSAPMAYTRKYGASSRGSAARRIQRSYRRKRLSGKAALTKRVSAVNRNKNCLSVDGLIDMEKRKVYIFELTNPGQSTDERVYIGGGSTSLPFNPRIYTQDFGSTDPIGESTTIFESTVIKPDEDENTDRDRRFNMAAASKALCQPDPSGIYLSYVDLTIRLKGVVTNAYVHLCIVRQKHRNLCGENVGYMWKGNTGLNTPSPTFPEAAGLFKNLANPLASNSICRDDYQVLHEQRILINSKTTVTPDNQDTLNTFPTTSGVGVVSLRVPIKKLLTPIFNTYDEMRMSNYPATVGSATHGPYHYSNMNPLSTVWCLMSVEQDPIDIANQSIVQFCPKIEHTWYDHDSHARRRG